MRSELRRHDIVLETKLSPGLKPVVADRVQVQQVILNLVMNGIEAMNTITGRSRVLRLSSRLDGVGAVLIGVADTGTGPPAELSDTLCDAFVTTKPEGVGLGLALAQRVATDHGGRLSWGREGGETRFRLTLPIRAASPRGAA